MNLTSKDGAAGPDDPGGHWDFLTNHAHVLLCVSRDPGIRLRDIASSIGITERTAHRILSELVDAKYVRRQRNGRRNVYTIEAERPLRHPLVEERGIGDLLAVLHGPSQKSEG